MAARVGLTQRVEVVPAYGERRDCLDQAWTALLLALGAVPVPLPNRVEDAAALLDALALDAVILTGGNDPAHLSGASNPAPERDAFEQALLEQCDVRRLPVLGVCRGMQVLVGHHGGTLTELPGHVATRHGLERTAADPAPLALAARPEVNSYHRFGLLESGLGPRLAPLARAPDGSIEAVSHATLPQWGIMWHPEREPLDPSGPDARLLRSILFPPGGGTAG